MKRTSTLCALLALVLGVMAQGDFKVTTLQYEQLPDMNHARMSHIIFPSGDGFVVIGGHTTGFDREASAEIFENGTWRDLPTPHYVHDGGGSAILDDGRVLIFGGHNGGWGTGGGNAGIDVYNPSSQTFSDGGQMASGKAFARGVVLDGKVYISGDYWTAYYGSTPQPVEVWQGVGTTTLPGLPAYSYTYHYVCPKSDGSAFLMVDNIAGFYYYGSDYDPTLLDKVSITDGVTNPVHVALFSTWNPMGVTDAVRTPDYAIGDGRYLMVCSHNVEKRYAVVMLDADAEEATLVCELPNVVGESLVEWTNNLLVNTARKEAYVVTAGLNNEYTYTYYIATIDYEQGVVKEVSCASGFSFRCGNPGLALMSDGRILCTGGSETSTSNFDPHAHAFAFVPNSGITDNISTTSAASAQRATYYDLLGKPSSPASRGILIVRSADGSARKIFVP